MNDTETGIIGAVVMLAMFFGFFGSIAYINYAWEKWRSPCTKVYDAETLLYAGKSCFYETSSRGTGTMFQEKEQRFFFPRMVKEVISDNIRIETVSCKGL